jgi:hypothetical protein
VTVPTCAEASTTEEPDRKARDKGEGRAMLPGFVPTACTQRTLVRTREIRQVQAELVRSNELTR